MGGGGASGAVSWPTYLQDVHADWLLSGTGGSEIGSTNNITEITRSKLRNSPWGPLNAYDPETEISEWEAAMAAYASILAGIDVDGWSTFFGTASAAIGTPDTAEVDDIEIADISLDSISDIEIDDIAADAVSDAAVDDAEGVTDAEIILDVDAFADQLDDEINTKVLPRFRRGMQDINAVVSSAFVLGASNIEAFRDRDVSKHNSQLRVDAAMKNADVDVANMDKDVRVALANQGKDLDIAKINITKDIDVSKVNFGKDVTITQGNLSKSIEVAKANIGKDVQLAELNLRTMADYKRIYIEATSQLVQYLAQRIGWEEGLAKLTIESRRIAIVARKEQVDMDNTIDVNDSQWDLEVFQYGANLMAAISGGTTVSPGGFEKPSAAASAIGGGLSGAALGAQVGGMAYPGYGHAIGAAVGGILGAAGALIARNN